MNLKFDTPIQFLKGVGPKIAALFEQKGIYSVGDLLQWYPRGYLDCRAVRDIASLKENDFISIKAHIHKISSYRYQQRLLHDIFVKDESGEIRCRFFRTPYRGYFSRFEKNKKVQVIGKVVNFRDKLEFHHPEIRDWEDSINQEDRLIPIYSEIGFLSQKQIIKLIGLVIDSLSKDHSFETLPKEVIKKYHLESKLNSLKYIHQPPKDFGIEYIHSKSPYHRRLIFEEFFWFVFNVSLRKKNLMNCKGPQFLMNKMDLYESFLKTLSFKLTQGQQNVLSDIVNDFKKPYPMNRLLQGDVGCGKTVVAIAAALLAIEEGYQVSFMVPTEILADQHFLSAKKLLTPLGISVEILKGQLKSQEKERILSELKLGKIQLCIGTHALIQSEVEFAKLGLVIIDEQHRFGVIQRKLLKEKGEEPHFLIMTATPIPRTLALTVYGDLDLSIIPELPQGRHPVLTRHVLEEQREKVSQFLKDQLKKGRQAYIVYPLVEESEKIQLKNAHDEFVKWQNKLEDFHLALLHGQMSSEEKQTIMSSFRRGEIQVLVTTTVIEVGVDVPNANLMIIENVERFGLSQLHQLRGRVGRGAYPSYCVLMQGSSHSKESYERAKILVETIDGFKIAEADLKLRGPGEFLGVRQSGLSGFKIANLIRDESILNEAREASFSLDPIMEILKTNPTTIAQCRN